MAKYLLEQQLLEALADISEIEATGFSVRAGLTGAGVTLLKGRTYFGAWRLSHGALVWSYANGVGASFFADTVEEATRHSMLMILKSLEASRAVRYTGPELRLAAG